MRPEEAKREREGERASTLLSGRSLGPQEEGGKAEGPLPTLGTRWASWTELTPSPPLSPLSSKTRVKQALIGYWCGTFGPQMQ